MGKCKICGNGAFPGYDYCMNCNPNKDRKERDVGYKKRHGGGQYKGVSSQLPKHCIFDTFYDEDDNIIADIFLHSGKDAAEAISSGMKKTQVRNFLRYLRGIEIPLKMPTKPDFKTVRPQLDELFSYTVYQANRDRAPYSKLFKQFYQDHLELIKKNEREFFAFVKYISSIIAYMTELENKSKHQKKFR